jgi:hypothetical protein
MLMELIACALMMAIVTLLLSVMMKMRELNKLGNRVVGTLFVLAFCGCVWMMSLYWRISAPEDRPMIFRIIVGVPGFVLLLLLIVTAYEALVRRLSSWIERRLTK